MQVDEIYFKEANVSLKKKKTAFIISTSRLVLYHFRDKKKEVNESPRNDTICVHFLTYFIPS